MANLTEEKCQKSGKKYGVVCCPSRSTFVASLLKNTVRPKRFSLNEEAITFAINYFAEKNVEYYLDGLHRWEHRWEKCVKLQGDYVEIKF